MIREILFIGSVIAGLGVEMTLVPRAAFGDEPATGFFQRLGQFDAPSKNSRSHESVRSAFRDVVSTATKSTVRILVGGNQVALGTVVHADGLVLTKASELDGDVVCALRDGRRLPAKIVGIAHNYDLALLKVAKVKLIAVEWAADKRPQVGAWLATASCAADPRAIGIVSALPRRIPMPVAVLGITLRATRQGAQVMDVKDRKSVV